MTFREFDQTYLALRGDTSTFSRTETAIAVIEHDKRHEKIIAYATTLEEFSVSLSYELHSGGMSHWMEIIDSDDTTQDVLIECYVRDAYGYINTLYTLRLFSYALAKRVIQSNGLVNQVDDITDMLADMMPVDTFD